MTRYGIYPLGDKTDCSGLDCSAYTLANNKIYDGAITEREITIADCSSNQTLVNGVCENISNCKGGRVAQNHTCECPQGAYCGKELGLKSPDSKYNSILMENVTEDVCEKGYRLPTKEDYEKIYNDSDLKSNIQNVNYGIFGTQKCSNGRCILDAYNMQTGNILSNLEIDNVEMGPYYFCVKD